MFLNEITLSQPLVVNSCHDEVGLTLLSAKDDNRSKGE